MVPRSGTDLGQRTTSGKRPAGGNGVRRANTGANNGDSQDRRQNTPLMDGSQTSAADEHLQLNESSIWEGSRANRLNLCAPDAIPQIRQQLLDSKGIDGAKISAAEKLAKDCMIGRPPGMPSYSPLGDLYLRASNKAPITDYRRQLDLGTGVVRVTYTMNGVHFTREIFASVPEQVIVVSPHSGPQDPTQL